MNQPLQQQLRRPNLDRIADSLGLLSLTIFLGLGLRRILQQVRQLGTHTIIPDSNKPLNLPILESLFNGQIFNCDNHSIYCFSDLDCLQSCDKSISTNDQLSGEFRCDRTQCVRNSIFQNNQCPINRGCVLLVKGNTTIGDILFDCYSTSSYFTSDCRQQSRWVCNDGHLLDRDYSLSVPTPVDCISEYNVLIYRPGAGTQAIPITTKLSPNVVEHFLKINSTILSKK